MSRYSSAYSASDLLTVLSDNAFVEKGDKELEAFVVEQQQELELPLYLRALVGVGAFFASLCFISLIVTGFSIRDEESFIALGVMFALLALVAQKFAGNGRTVKSSFLIQSSFALMATGKSLFVFGVVEVFETGWAATGAILILTLATYHVYRMSVDRFLSSFALLLSILLNLLLGDDFSGSKEFLFNGFLLIQVVLTVFLISNAKIKKDYRPIEYSLLFSLCAAAITLASQHEFGYWGHEEFIRPVFADILFTAALVVSIGWVAGGVSKLKSEPLMLACLAAVALGVVSAPGIILSVALMILGYGKHEKIMTAMGALLLPLFLFFYYYNLEVSLLQKSGVLVGSGVTLLAGRFYLRFRNLDKGEEA
ncbi:DUF4401 domain-containing protein [Pelagibius sp. Alg239-R121]|uniref:DUF4401 domain-containing protein n=1 Tax=Pelagibius sp. Alg239-R121 TaxID=2993448 RepID=UPI0024A612F2|nr:DUF4401 domain-containing protein [Pelagibius sp. Alg239-R121]